MKRVLFLYKFGILGGVCTQLYHRLTAIPKNELEVHCGFMGNHGAEDLLGGSCELHFSLDGNGMVELLEREKFDLVVIIDTEEYIEQILEMETRPRVLIEVHTSIERNLEYLTRIPENLPYGFITVSEYMREEVLKRVGYLEANKLKILGNIIDTSKFTYSELQRKEGVPPLVWVGKIDDHKNWRLAMEISGVLRDRGVVHELWFVGGHTASGARSEEFFTYAEECGIIDTIKWFDKIEHSEISKLLRRARNLGGVGLVTSKGESFGMSILESILVGLPVVSANSGAISEISELSPALGLYELQDSENAIKMISERIGGWRDNSEWCTILRGESALLAEKFGAEGMGREYWSHIIEICNVE